MSFLDYVLASFGVFEKQTPKQKKTNFNLRQNFEDDILKPNKNEHKLAIFCPKNLDEVVEVAEFLSTNQPLMLNISNLCEADTKRALDFLFGAISATKSDFVYVGKGIYIFAPKGTKILNRTNENE